MQYKIGDKINVLNGLICEIVSFRNGKDITVLFENGATRTTSSSNLKRGALRCPMVYKEYNDFIECINYNTTPAFSFKIDKEDLDKIKGIRFKPTKTVRATVYIHAIQN